MLKVLEFALAGHINSHVDSALASTREFWRRKLGFPEDVVTDPRPIAEIAASLTATPAPQSNLRGVQPSKFVYSSVMPKFKNDDTDEVDHLECWVHTMLIAQDQAELYRQATALAEAATALTSPSPETNVEGDFLKPSTTARGFGLLTFTDRSGTECTLQESSLATEAAIWFGAAKLEVKRFPGNYTGWHDVDFAALLPGQDIVGNERMHLTQDHVRRLLPALQHFAETGELPTDPSPQPNMVSEDCLDSEDHRDRKIASVVPPDNGTPHEVLLAVLECAKSWAPEAGSLVMFERVTSLEPSRPLPNRRPGRIAVDAER
jgi:hypothetical protein